MKEEIKLTWKYFIQQKITETFFIIIAFFVIWKLPIFIGRVLHKKNWNCFTYCGNGMNYMFNCSNWDYFNEGFLWLVIAVIFFFLVTWWVNQNWKKARRNARFDIEYKKEKKTKRAKTSSKRIRR